MNWRTRAVEYQRGLWRLSGARGIITPDSSGYGNHGTLVNAPTFADTPWGVGCMVFDGDDAHVNVGDLTYLNAVSAFTIAFWMRQDATGQLDIIFDKTVTGNISLLLHTSAAGALLLRVRNGASTQGSFNYLTLIPPLTWRHVAWVFDGSGSTDADKLKAYVNAVPVTLVFAGPIPAVTADTSGQDATIGYPSNSFDGRLFRFYINSAPLTRDEVGVVMRGYG